MGRGNVCVHGKYEGLYYVDNGFLEMYSKRYRYEDMDTCLRKDIDNLEDGWEFDEEATYQNFDDFERAFVSRMLERFPSMHKPRRGREWVSRSQRVVVENKLFYVVFEDNTWSLAVELIQKEPPFGDGSYEGLQANAYKSYLKGILHTILELTGEAGTYKGAWAHGTIKIGGES